MDLSPVSRTAILLLICRAIESERSASGYHDPMAVLCLERLLSLASDEDRRWILREKRIYAGFHKRDAQAGVRRSQVFDKAANRFIAENPGCTVINLGCGLDTTYWRIEHGQCTYIELDLPEVVGLKKELLGDRLSYEVIGGSTLDTSWIDHVTADGDTRFLLLAEGLFMFFPPQEAIRVFKEIGERFHRSQLVLDLVPEKYTRGILAELLRLEIKLTWGLDAVRWVYGVKDPREIEGYGSGLKIIGEEKGTAGPILAVSINADPRETAS